MKRIGVQILIWILAATLGVLLAARFNAFSGRQPHDLGVHDGLLKRPSKTPNSVSSQAGLWPGHPQAQHAAIAPLALVGDGPATIARIATLLEGRPRTRIVERRPDYLYVQFTTKLMRFVDDAEFWYDPAHGVVQVRSASRVGRGDHGVNRARIEALRARLAGS